MDIMQSFTGLGLPFEEFVIDVSWIVKIMRLTI